MKPKALLSALLCALTTAVYAQSIQQLLEDSGVQGGVVLHLGCADGSNTAKLFSNSKFIVCGLDTDAAAIRQAKAKISEQGIYGKVSAEVFDGRNLPFGDNIVNLIVADKRADLSVEEIERVLVPNGVLMLRSGVKISPASSPKKEKSIKEWAKYSKPQPADIDEWTHFLYGPANNAVSKDRLAGKPRHVQWFAGPEHTRDHDALASMSAMTTSGGRIFYVFDEGPISVIHQPSDWKLIARDAFNGKLLWKRDIPTWMTHLYNFRGGPVQLPRRLVSVGDEVFVTLGFTARVEKLDAATGETLLTFKGSQKSEEILVQNKMMLTVTGDPEFLIGQADECEGYWEISEKIDANAPRKIAAWNSETGKCMWELTNESIKSYVPLSLCTQNEKVFYLDEAQLHCLSASSGKQLWASDFKTVGRFIRAYAPTVVIQDDVILCLAYNRLVAFSTETGKELWENKGSIGFGSPGDLFVRKGLAWLLPMKKGIKKEALLNSFPAQNAVAIDIHTGEELKSMPFTANQHHSRCFRHKATEECIVLGYSGIQIFDYDEGTTDVNQWVRGLCQYGMMPANGYIYVPPDPCQCYRDVKVNGFLALSEKSSIDNLEIKSALEKGELYGKEIKSESADSTEAKEWPTFRGNSERNALVDVSLSKKPAACWEADIGESITAPVIAERKVFIANRDAYTLYCLDAESGKKLWRFMANGPIDSPPTISEGRCVFGSGDGSIYCLSAKSGGLIWRFKTSALERRIGAEDRLESPWRINGAVLVRDSIVYFAAGRSSHLDGGIKLYGVELKSGENKYFHELKSKRNNKNGSLAGIFCSRDKDISMRGATFDTELKPKKVNTSVRGMLDGSWFHRHPGAGKTAQMAVGEKKDAIGVANHYTGLKKSRSVKPTNQTGSKWNQVGHLHQKYTRYLEKEWFPVGAKIQGKGWSINEDFQPRAMLLAGDNLYLAGWLDDMDIELKSGRPVSAGRSKERPAVMRVYSAKDGSRIAESSLDSNPTWDGMAAAYGKLFISQKNGKLICLE